VQKNLSPKIVFILLSMLFCLVESNVFSRCEFTHLTESVLKGEEGGEKGKKEGRKQNSFLMTRRIALSHLSLSVRCHPFLSLTVFICKTISNELSIKKVVDRHSFIMSCVHVSAAGASVARCLLFCANSPTRRGDPTSPYVDLVIH
jgi:hypothetical protein